MVLELPYVERELERILLNLFYVHWCLACMHVCMWVSDLGFTDSCELPCESWDLNPGFLEE